MIPDPPRPLTPSMRRRLWTDGFVGAVGLLLASLIVIGMARTAAQGRARGLGGFATGIIIVGVCSARGWTGWRRAQLWRHGRATEARLTEDHDVEFDLDGDRVVVPQDDLVDGPLRGRSLVLVDPRNPRRPLVVSIAMLTPDAVASELRVDQALLPPTPRAPNPRWNARKGVGIGPVAALGGVVGLALLVGAGAAADDFAHVRPGCFGFVALLVVAAALIILDMVRTAARRRALWRHGLEARADVRLENDVGYWMRVEVGDVRWEGARKISPRDRVLIDPDGARPVILIDPHDPEGLDVVLMTDVGRRF